VTEVCIRIVINQLMQIAVICGETVYRSMLIIQFQ